MSLDENVEKANVPKMLHDSDSIGISTMNKQQSQSTLFDDINQTKTDPSTLFK